METIKASSGIITLQQITLEETVVVLIFIDNDLVDAKQIEKALRPGELGAIANDLENGLSRAMSEIITGKEVRENYRS